MPPAGQEQQLRQTQFQPVLKSSYLNKPAARSSQERPGETRTTNSKRASVEATSGGVSHSGRFKATDAVRDKKMSAGPFTNQDLEAVTDNTANSQQILPIEHQQSSMHVMRPTYEEIPERVVGSDNETGSDPELQRAQRANLRRLMMQTDEMYWSGPSRPQDYAPYAMLDYV